MCKIECAKFWQHGILTKLSFHPLTTCSQRVPCLLDRAQGSLLEASLGTWDQAKPDPRCPCQARGYLKTGPTLEYPEHIFFYQLNDIKKNKEKQHDIVWYIILCQ